MPGHSLSSVIAALLVAGLGLSMIALSLPSWSRSMSPERVIPLATWRFDVTPTTVALVPDSGTDARDASHHEARPPSGCADLLPGATASPCSRYGLRGYGDVRDVLRDAAAATHRRGAWYAETRTDVWINAPTSIGSTSPP